MKKATIILTLLLAGWLGASGQNHQYMPDSAELVVKRYYDLLNYEGICRDSILYIETIIFKRSDTTDKAVLKRWFLTPNSNRVELWHGDTLMEGVYSNGVDVFREYRRGVLDGWTRVAESRYYNVAPDYDFRGALYTRKADAAEMKYEGLWDFNGHTGYRVYVDTPFKYCRNYLFEKESGLLFFVQYTNKHSQYTNHQAYDHPDWHAIHEYQPLGNILLPSVESYQMKGDMVYHFSRGRYLPIDNKIFNED